MTTITSDPTVLFYNEFTIDLKMDSTPLTGCNLIFSNSFYFKKNLQEPIAETFKRFNTYVCGLSVHLLKKRTRINENRSSKKREYSFSLGAVRSA